MGEILGISTALIGAILLIVGILALLLKGSIGSFARSTIGWLPVNPKTAAVLVIVVGILLGGIGTVMSWAPSISTASITGQDADSVPGVSSLSCSLTSISKVNAGENVTLRADPTNLNKYYVDVKYDSPAAVINGTLNCDRGVANTENAEAFACVVKSQTFRSETSTTDSNTYYILETSASASKVPGYPYAQTAHLNDGSVASTSSKREKTNLQFTGGDSAQSQETLGFYFKLPGTPFTYLNNQSSRDVVIDCGGNQVFDLVITKTSA